jgi:myo-inositol-1(or 4)-monophosphatase
VSIALDQGGETIIGVTVDPMRNEIFWAEKGRGAWLGSRKLARVLPREMSSAIAATGIPHRGSEGHAAYLASLARVMPQVAGVRRFGSATLDLAYVAAGRFDIFFERGLSPWDVAAGVLLVREAGGVVTRTDGTVVHLDGDVLAASSADLHALFLELLAPLHHASDER